MEKALVGVFRYCEIFASALRTADTLVTCLTLDSEPDIVRDDGGGGHLALVLAAVSPGSRPEHGHGHNTVVTSCDSQHHGHTGNNITMI